MKSHRDETDRILNDFLKELGEPVPEVRARRTSNRVLENLASLEPAAVQAPALPAKRRWTPVAAVAAALLATAVFVGTLSLPSNAEPIARRLSGKLIADGDKGFIGEGKLIQSDDSGSELLELRDGSRVEMSEGVELSIHNASDGIQIDLEEGNIIVTAAKQHRGHLYVKTRDIVVSVVGTVFSVKAEAAGSRVAVIEGEVHVKRGDTTQTLLPGQQVITSTEMKAVPLQTELGWSQDAAVHTAMLQQATPTPTPNTATVENPDLVGEVRRILAPPGQADVGGAIAKNKTLFFELWKQGRETQQLPVGSFNFAITGIQGRTISFINSKDETFSFGCADCSFAVTENGVSKTISDSEPGVEFKLSADGSALTATCHAAPCYMSRWVATATWTTNGTVSHQFPFWASYATRRTNLETPNTFTIPTSQLTAQTDGSVLFVITK